MKLIVITGLSVLTLKAPRIKIKSAHSIDTDDAALF